MALNTRLGRPAGTKATLNPSTWLREETVAGFSDFIQQKRPHKGGKAKEPEKSSFNINEMLLETEIKLIEAAKRNDVAAMKLWGRGVNANVKNLHNRTALHFAVAGNNKEAVELLLLWRVKVDQKDIHGVAPIHLAAWFDCLDILKLLVRAGADQKICNNEGLNIIHCAAINNHSVVLQYIIEDLQMKELDKPDRMGHTPFALAAECGCLEMLDMLMSPAYEMASTRPNKNGDTPLHLAAGHGHFEEVGRLLESFETRDEINMAEETALYLATERGHEECVRVLLQADCNPNIVTSTKRSPLHSVAERGDTSLLRLLLDHDAQTDFQDQNLEAPLHLAVKNFHIPAIHMLLEAGCNINVADKRSQTVMHLSAELGRVDIVEMLVKAGVDLTLLDKHNKTALGVAARADEVAIVDMIIKAERYNAWREAHSELNEDLHSQCPLTFKLDHRQETKQFRSTVWHLSHGLLKPGDWKRLAEQWDFTREQVEAIEAQWTGQQSYREHGNRMLLIWLHTVELAGKSPAKELYQGLISTSNRAAADKLRKETKSSSSKNCNIS
ncbi:ankyrin repeat and death domain-containing protein 1A isoform X2 [Gadus chalcogrammus]|uniref:ankyrin repeat and death domain-containing protein 1A isoform X2 n=1 Tax=Gadus chalcogrammus TaxID=1042646 RepID=UPI0024C28A72|nr:ankyrin repeat and death domain-containing protein 1A isoform X2 [Gadus chalcogrammus]